MKYCVKINTLGDLCPETIEFPETIEHFKIYYKFFGYTFGFESSLTNVFYLYPTQDHHHRVLYRYFCFHDRLYFHDRIHGCGCLHEIHACGCLHEIHACGCLHEIHACGCLHEIHACGCLHEKGALGYQPFHEKPCKKTCIPIFFKSFFSRINKTTNREKYQWLFDMKLIFTRYSSKMLIFQKFYWKTLVLQYVFLFPKIQADKGSGKWLLGNLLKNLSAYYRMIEWHSFWNVYKYCWQCLTTVGDSQQLWILNNPQVSYIIIR